MSSHATPAGLVDPAGQPYPSAETRIERIMDLESVWQKEATVEWLVEGIIPNQSVNLISAESGTGKTWLAYAIAGAVAHGVPFAGRTVRKAPVLYLDGENPLVVVKRDLADLGIPETPDLHVWAGWNKEGPPGPDDSRIKSFVEEFHPLLIWDSLVEFANCDEQSSTEIRAFMKKFRTLAHLGATIVVLHHTGKSSSSKQYRGSSDIKASVDTAYVVTGKDRSGKLHELMMTPFKSRIAPGAKVGLRFFLRKGFSEVAVVGQGAKPDAADIVRGIVIANPSRNGTFIKSLAKSQGVGRDCVDEILTNGEYSIESGRGSEKKYKYIPHEDLVPEFQEPSV